MLNLRPNFRWMSTCGSLMIVLGACDRTPTGEHRYPLTPNEQDVSNWIDVDENTKLYYEVTTVLTGSSSSETIALEGCRHGEYSSAVAPSTYQKFTETATLHPSVANDLGQISETLPGYPIYIPEGEYKRVEQTTITTKYLAKVTVWRHERPNGVWMMGEKTESSAIYELKERRAPRYESCHDQGGGASVLSASAGTKGAVQRVHRKKYWLRKD